jgi:hypothetical protein
MLGTALLIFLECLNRMIRTSIYVCTISIDMVTYVEDSTSGGSQIKF